MSRMSVAIQSSLAPDSSAVICPHLSKLSSFPREGCVGSVAALNADAVKRSSSGRLQTGRGTNCRLCNLQLGRMIFFLVVDYFLSKHQQLKPRDLSITGLNRHTHSSVNRCHCLVVVVTNERRFGKRKRDKRSPWKPQMFEWGALLSAPWTHADRFNCVFCREQWSPVSHHRLFKNPAKNFSFALSKVDVFCFDVLLTYDVLILCHFFLCNIT